MRRLHAALVASALAAWAPTVRASPTARLVYARSPGAETCPDEDGLRRAVASRIGYDPFFAWAPKTVVVTLSPGEARGFVASVALVDERGMQHGARALRTDSACDDLLGVTALAIAIAIDPQSLAPRPAAPAPPPAPAVSAPPAPAPEAPRVPSPEASATAGDDARGAAARPPAPQASVRVEASLGAVASLGVAPAPVVGGAPALGLRYGVASIAVEGRFDAPASTAVARGGVVQSWTALGAIVVCGHAGPLFACGLGEAGAIRAQGDGVADAHTAQLAWVAAGARFGVDFPAFAPIALRVRSDFVVDALPPQFRFDGVNIWTAPRVASSLGVDGVVHFR
jgi:hypothetical protein